MNLSDFFKLVRYKNLILIAYLLLLIHFIFLPSFNVQTKLSLLQFVCLIFSILFITAAGYIINDIFDVKADLINKPKKVIVSKKLAVGKAKVFYKNSNSIGLIFGIFVSISTQNPSYSFIFISTAVLLYWYSKYVKKKPLVGNILVAFLSAIIIPLLLIFDIENFNFSEPQIILTLVTFFAFIVSLIRELIKDIEDINGDKKLVIKTLPIIIGRKRTKTLVVYLIFTCIILIAYLSITYSKVYKYTMLYLILAVFIPLAIMAIKLINLKTYKQIHRYSTAIKIIMFLGINSLLILAYS
jgi:4-hydroxybenzoate polyprenyltransferase